MKHDWGRTEFQLLWLALKVGSISTVVSVPLISLLSVGKNNEKSSESLRA